MRHILLIVLALIPFLLACASAPTSRRQCPEVVVENQNWNRVTVYDADSRRMGAVDGLSRRSFKQCRLLNRPERFRIVGFANSFSLSLRGDRTYLQATDITHITIGASPNLSFIREE